MKTKYQYSPEMQKEIDEFYLKMERLKPLEKIFKQARNRVEGERTRKFNRDLNKNQSV